AFHDALCSRYRVVYINADRRRLEGTLLQGITALPTFTAPGRRIVGYTSPADLLARLELPALAPERQPDRPSFPSLPQSPSAPPAQPPATLPPPAVPQVPDLPDEPPSEEPTTDQKLPEAAAPDERPPARPQAGNREFNAPQSPSVPAQPLPDPAPPAEPADAAVHLPEVDSPGSAPRSAEAPSGGTPADRPASTPAAPSSRKPVELPAVVTWLARPVALYFGGPLAAAAVGAVGWWWGRRQQRRSARPQNHYTDHPLPAQPAPPRNADPAISLSSEPRTETRYVRVPVADQEGEAWREAVRRMAELHPGAVPLLNTLESTATQLLHGRRVTSGSSSIPQAKPGLWTDPPP
ncbi:MAG: hypothetical protein KDA79_19705, partial [Planctomycetaceae bacterium]|nr:hypothetical protein [Planctomycetaceae bacterium]